MKRILVIRGGAIGDFILTLPTLKALRDGHPHAHVEIMGYRHIVALAENRFYAQAVRSIEYGPLSSFFAKASDLPPELADYFRGFDLIISYLYDPDEIFETNLRRSGVGRILRGPAKIATGTHAAEQLAAPIRSLGIEIADFSPRFFPSEEDQRFARDFLQGLPGPILTVHPGSGSERKNWPVENWTELGRDWLAANRSLVVAGGEADDVACRRLESEWGRHRCARFARSLPLPRLGAILEASIFLGHDSGISHLAAASGARCILLFGPSDPDIWAPRNENVQVLRSGKGAVEGIGPEEVERALAALLETAPKTTGIRR
jgi:heptosyltransferase-3